MMIQRGICDLPPDPGGPGKKVDQGCSGIAAAVPGFLAVYRTAMVAGR